MNIETAKRIPGPKTPKGKVASSLNAVKHGALALTIPPHERNAFDRHRAGIVESLQPANYLEERLADRVALTLWRLRRLDAWEAAVLQAEARKALEGSDVLRSLGDHLARVLDEEPRQRPVGALSLSECLSELQRLTFLEPERVLRDGVEAEEAVSDHEREAGALMALPAEPTPAELEAVPPDPAADLGQALWSELSRAGVKAETVARAALGGKATPAEVEALENDDWEWQPKELPGVWALLAATHAKKSDAVRSPNLVRLGVAYIATNNARRAREVLDRLRSLMGERLGLAAIPGPEVFDRLSRYEAHLERVLYKALHELEAMRDRSAGKAAPLARLDVSGDREPT